ncbi:MAG: DsbA family protein [Candidatus Paceibacteria bacterium]
MDSKLMIPASIIIAAIVIAGALFVVNKGDSPKVADNNDGGTGQEANVGGSMKPISEDDHILGNPNADIIIVEYSDTECPFCKRFHDTMHQVIDEYGKDGKVAWVYRHFPLAQLHPKAVKEAEATECAFDQGGNTAFWAYTDRLYEVTPSNNGLDMDQLPEIAGDVGLDVEEFERCLDDGDNKKKVADALADAFAAGGRGTPHNIMLVGDERIAIPGAQPFSAMKAAIDAVLTEEETE